jgi:hypothetical protein
MSMDLLTLGAGTSGIAEVLTDALKKAKEDKKTYTDKLESAEGDEIFKYILLINVSALEGYVAQTRIQAEQSFALSKFVALVGFVLLGVGIGLGVFLRLFSSGTNLDAAYLSAVAGTLIEFISGVFFYLYNRTLQQINLFHDKLVEMEKTSMAFLATSLVADAAKRDESKANLAQALVQVGSGPHKD